MEIQSIYQLFISYFSSCFLILLYLLFFPFFFFTFLPLIIICIPLLPLVLPHLWKISKLRVCAGWGNWVKFKILLWISKTFCTLNLLLLHEIFFSFLKKKNWHLLPGVTDISQCNSLVISTFIGIKYASHSGNLISHIGWSIGGHYCRSMHILLIYKYLQKDLILGITCWYFVILKWHELR